MKVASETSVAMPMRNLISIVVAVGLGVWAYFGLIEIDDGIRVLGNILSTSVPEIGQSVRMSVSFNSKPHYSFIVENN